MGFRASENGNAASVSEDQYGRSSDVSCIRRGNVCRRDTITPCSEESERHPEKEVKEKKGIRKMCAVRKAQEEKSLGDGKAKICRARSASSPKKGISLDKGKMCRILFLVRPPFA